MKKLIIFGIIVTLIISLGYLFITQKNKDKTPLDSGQTTEENENLLDLNGDGEKEHIVLEMPENEPVFNLKSIKAYDKTNTEIASLPSEMIIKVPMSGSFRVYKLSENDPKEYFSLEFIDGPHQSETMFFGFREDRILPICFNKIPEGPYDCLFYSGNVGYLPVKDLDGDGDVELIEVVDEYPSEGKLSDEEKAAIDKVIEEDGVTEFTENAERIALREKGGRGKSVVWAIFSYNGRYFIPQLEDDYEKYYSLIGDLIKNKMRKSELSEDSLEYIQFVKGFWGHKSN